jgi:hypothetical protein
MCGPLLKYDTVVDDMWLGYAMLVVSDTGSDYSTKPTLSWASKPRSVSSPRSIKSPFGLETPMSGLSMQDAQGGGQAGQRAQGVQVEAIQLYKYHALHGGNTFFRFKLEVPMQDYEQAITYSINHGRQYTFYVAARGANMRWIGHSCNGFSAGVKTEDFNGPSPLWTDLLGRHKQEPFHALVGGGDQM